MLQMNTSADKCALMRLSLGALTIEQSLFLLPPVANSGDYNGNGTIDGSDYVVWRKSRGTDVNRGTSADGNANGTVDPSDYSYWRSRFGMPAGTGSLVAGLAQIPEPSTLAMGLVGLAILACQRRRDDKAAIRSSFGRNGHDGSSVVRQLIAYYEEHFHRMSFFIKTRIAPSFL